MGRAHTSMIPLFVAIPLLALVFVAGWVVHRRLSLNYKKRWLEAVGALSAKQLESADLQTDPPVRQFGRPQVSDRQTPNGAPRDSRHVEYEAGRWALSEDRSQDGRVTFYAVRRGFDKVKLGEAANASRFAALYRRDRENALDAVKAMNEGVTP